MPVSLALALAAAASAQITSGSSTIGYNDGEEAYNSDFSFLQQESQFLFLDNPPTTSLTAPFSDYTFTNPLNLASGEIKANTSLTSLFSFSSTLASVSGVASARSEAISHDPFDTYFGWADGEANMTLHLDSAGSVTFNVDAIDLDGDSVVQYGIDNTFVGDFVTPGVHSDTHFLSAGDHYFYLFYDATVNGVAGSDVVSLAAGEYNVTVTTAPVPEPATLSASIMGLVGMAMRRRRMRASKL